MTDHLGIVTQNRKACGSGADCAVDTEERPKETEPKKKALIQFRIHKVSRFPTIP